MTKRPALKTLLAGCAVTLACASLHASPPSPASNPETSSRTSGSDHDMPPNILYIMADDHAAHAIGAYGGRLAELNPTPTLDRLARNGALFTNTFCNNSICTPSRASILTGQYSQTNGVLDLDGHLPPERQYLPMELKKAGYQTAIIGKWHLKDEPAAFDYYSVMVAAGQQGTYFDPEFIQTGMKFGKHGDPGIETIQYKGHSTDVVTDQTLDWLENKRDKDRPFFLMYHFKAPHDLFENAPRYDSYLEDVDVPEPDSLWERGNHGSVATRGENDSLIHEIGSSVSKRNPNRNQGQALGIDPNLPDDEYTRQSYQLYLKRYLRCVRGIDDNVKRVLDYLEQNNLLDNTVIIYTSDQGMMLGEHDYIDKRWMYEESLRMPFIMHYPKAIKPGTKVDAIVNNTDFAPTILDYAGLPTPDYMQGRSFRSIVETGKVPDDWQTSTYYRYWMHMVHHDNPAHFGVRTRDYKLIFYYGRDVIPEGRECWGSRAWMHTPPGWELYDMRNDPFEMNNLYGNPAYADVVRQLKAELKRLRETLNETDENYPHIQAIIDEHWDD